MVDTASRYITPSGRTANYDRAAYVDDMVTFASFMAWAEHEGEYFGGATAGDAFKAACRMLDVDPIKLRKIALGDG